MSGLLRLLCGLVVDLFRSRAALEAEILVLRQQIIVRRGKATRLFRAADRLVLLGLQAVSQDLRSPRHRAAGDRSALASRRLSVLLALEVERLARTPCPISGNPEVYQRDEHCQSLVGSAADSRRTAQARIDVGQTSVAKYISRSTRSPSQGWKTFLRNHANGIAAIELFVVPTVSFRLLYGLLTMGHGRRQILWLGVTAHPTAEWIANQLTQALRLGAGTKLSDPRPGCLLW